MDYTREDVQRFLNKGIELLATSGQETEALHWLNEAKRVLDKDIAEFAHVSSISKLDVTEHTGCDPEWMTDQRLYDVAEYISDNTSDCYWTAVTEWYEQETHSDDDHDYEGDGEE